jgi:hypothetical protein
LLLETNATPAPAAAESTDAPDEMQYDAAISLLGDNTEEPGLPPEPSAPPVADEAPIDPVDARRAERMARADAAEQRILAQRERKQEQAWRAQQAQERADIAAQRAELETARRQTNEIATALRNGGPEALKAIGVDYAEWTNQQLQAASPEAAAQRALREMAELRTELAQREQAQAQARHEAQLEAHQARAQQHRERGLQYAAAELEKSAEQFPNTYTLPEHVLEDWVVRGTQILHQRTGRVPTTAELFSAIEQDAIEYHGSIEQRRAKLASRTLPSNGTTQTTGQLAARPKTRTIGNAASAQVAHDHLDKMDDEEREALAIRQLSAGRRAT